MTHSFIREMILKVNLQTFVQMVVAQTQKEVTIVNVNLEWHWILQQSITSFDIFNSKIGITQIFLQKHIEFVLTTDGVVAGPA